MKGKMDAAKGVAAALAYVCLLSSFAMLFTIAQWPGHSTTALADSKNELKNKYGSENEAIKAGEGLFRQYCSACHADGTGGIGPDLTDDEWKYGGADNDVYESVSKGRPGGMPAWNTRIDDDGIWKIVAFLRSKHR